MPKNTEILMCQGEPSPSREFLLEYQRCVLLALEKEGVIDHDQLEECIYRLCKQGL